MNKSVFHLLSLVCFVRCFLLFPSINISINQQPVLQFLRLQSNVRNPPNCNAPFHFVSGLLSCSGNLISPALANRAESSTDNGLPIFPPFLCPTRSVSDVPKSFARSIQPDARQRFDAVKRQHSKSLAAEVLINYHSHSGAISDGDVSWLAGLVGIRTQTLTSKTNAELAKRVSSRENNKYKFSTSTTVVIALLLIAQLQRARWIPTDGQCGVW